MVKVIKQTLVLTPLEAFRVLGVDRDTDTEVVHYLIDDIESYYLMGDETTSHLQHSWGAGTTIEKSVEELKGLSFKKVFQLFYPQVVLPRIKEVVIEKNH